MEQQRRVIGAEIGAAAGKAEFGNVKKPGPLVEDETVVGGVDASTGAPVVRPKTPDGKADCVTEATDPSERP